MKTFEIDGTGDWTLETIEEDQELIQCLKHLIYERLGEWFLNQDHGFERSVFEEKDYTDSDIVQAIYDAIYQEPRIIEVIKVDFNFNRITRLLSLAFRLRTENGEAGGEFNVNF